jgi:type II secretory ATPase GspE/PulE/Tfp pilus assembly ATPase PilB-like protein
MATEGQLKIVAEEEPTRLLAEEAGVERVDLEQVGMVPAALELVSADVAFALKVFPVAVSEETLVVAMANPLDLPTIDELQNLTGRYIEVRYAPEPEILKALRRSYKRVAPEEREEELRFSAEEASVQVAAAGEEIVGAQVINLVNSLISLAIRDTATDIHIEPEEKSVASRFRIDGILHTGPPIPKHFQAAVTTRIKIMGGMNISENRLPQDGKTRFAEDGRTLDLRISTFPTVHGENIVLRLLDKERLVLGLEQLGFAPGALRIFQDSIQRPNGIILVTGPTGSGKTTTLYAALAQLNSQERNIVTLEDPVEYEMPGIRQSQINLKAGLTFATGLRAILRQDPDIILVGEIRDGETVEVAIRSALTGHLVFSTLHTNDAMGAIPRLLNMGVEPYLLASGLVSVMAQRLVRVICPHCRERVEPDEALLKTAGLDPRPEGAWFYRGRGCSQCRHTGYKGRIAICEIVSITPTLSRLIMEQADSKRLERQAQEEGMERMMEDGLRKVFQGTTTLEEVIRVAHTL